MEKKILETVNDFRKNVNFFRKDVNDFRKKTIQQNMG